LLERGAKVKSYGERLQTALHKSCAVGNYDLVKLVTSACEEKYGRKELKEVRQQIRNAERV